MLQNWINKIRGIHLACEKTAFVSKYPHLYSHYPEYLTAKLHICLSLDQLQMPVKTKVFNTTEILSFNMLSEISFPDKRGVSGQKPQKAGHLTQQNKWETGEDMGRPTSIDPSKLFVGTLPLKVIWNTERCFLTFHLKWQTLTNEIYLTPAVLN